MRLWRICSSKECGTTHSGGQRITWTHIIPPSTITFLYGNTDLQRLLVYKGYEGGMTAQDKGTP